METIEAVEAPPDSPEPALAGPGCLPLRPPPGRPPRGNRAPTTRDLLEGFALTGDQGCFEEVVRRYGAMVLNVCREVTGHTHDAEDAMQAAFFVLAERLRAGDTIHSLGSWLQQVARRAALDIRRSRKRRDRRERDRAAPEATPGLDTEALDDRDLSRQIREELDKVPVKYRIPLLLHYFGGLDYAETAKELGIKPGTLGVRLFRGRKMLGERLARRGVTLSAAALPTLLMRVVRHGVSQGLYQSAARAAAAAANASALPGQALASASPALGHGVAALLASSKLKLVLAAALVVAAAAGAGAAVHRMPDLPPLLDFHRFRLPIPTIRTNVRSLRADARRAPNPAARQDDAAPASPAVAPPADKTPPPHPSKKPSPPRPVPGVAIASATSAVADAPGAVRPFTVPVAARPAAAPAPPQVAAAPPGRPATPTSGAGPAPAPGGGPVAAAGAPVTSTASAAPHPTAFPAGPVALIRPPANPGFPGVFAVAGDPSTSGGSAVELLSGFPSPTVAPGVPGASGATGAPGAPGVTGSTIGSTVTSVVTGSGAGGAAGGPSPSPSGYSAAVSVSAAGQILDTSRIGGSFLWSVHGTDTGLTSPGSVRVTLYGTTSTPSLAYLDPADPALPAPPVGQLFLSAWGIRTDQPFSAVDLIVRYDETALAAAGGDASGLSLWGYDGTWRLLAGPSSGQDPSQDLIWGQADGIQYFAVGTPEPAVGALVMVAGTFLLIRRRRKRPRASRA